MNLSLFAYYRGKFCWLSADLRTFCKVLPHAQGFAHYVEKWA